MNQTIKYARLRAQFSGIKKDWTYVTEMRAHKRHIWPVRRAGVVIL